MNKDWIGLEHLPRLLGLLAVIAAFAVLNLVLWFGQDVAHSGERKELEQLQSKLVTLRIAAQALEHQLEHDGTAIDNLKASLTDCKARVASYEASAEDGALPPGQYEQYEQTLAACNDQVVTLNARISAYQGLVDSYDKSVDDHNKLVPRANKLAKIVGTKYLVVPVPSVGRSRHSTVGR